MYSTRQQPAKRNSPDELGEYIYRGGYILKSSQAEQNLTQGDTKMTATTQHNETNTMATFTYDCSHAADQRFEVYVHPPMEGHDAYAVHVHVRAFEGDNDWAIGSWMLWTKTLKNLTLEDRFSFKENFWKWCDNNVRHYHHIYTDNNTKWERKHFGYDDGHETLKKQIQKYVRACLATPKAAVKPKADMGKARNVQYTAWSKNSKEVVEMKATLAKLREALEWHPADTWTIQETARPWSSFELEILPV